MTLPEADFEFEVIAYSKNTPVVVDFWAEWCQPCKVLTPLLEKLVGELGGSFRLAKVDVDANPNLAARFNVRSIPTVIAFSDASPARPAHRRAVRAAPARLPGSHRPAQPAEPGDRKSQRAALRPQLGGG